MLIEILFMQRIFLSVMFDPLSSLKITLFYVQMTSLKPEAYMEIYLLCYVGIASFARQEFVDAVSSLGDAGSTT